MEPSAVASGSCWRSTFDAIVLVSFGGPERRDDVTPFLDNVLRGKRVPPERVRAVADHYYFFDGVSPINAANRALLAALVAELNADGPQLPVYWGNRNWHPLLEDTLQLMAHDGIRHALAFVTSAFGSYSGCRQYLEDIERARQVVGAGAPRVEKLRLFYNHPGFIEPMADRVAAALAELPTDRRPSASLIYTAHSLPKSMAEGCDYVRQLHEACRLVSERLGQSDWQLAYQSRSGPPQQPWLEPDVRDMVRQLPERSDVIIAPIGFLSEHMETVYDLDVELAGLCESRDITMIRSGTVANHPRFVRMIRELILERIDPQAPRLALGSLGPAPDFCQSDCCRPD